MKYHKKIGFPDSINIPSKKIHFYYSKHADAKLHELNIDKWPIEIVLTKENIVELDTTDNQKIDNIVIRLPYDYQEDMILSLLLFKRTAVVKTLWLNNKGDQHDTLDKSIYDLPNNHNSKEIDQIYAGKIS